MRERVRPPVGVLVAIALREPEPWRARILSAATVLAPVEGHTSALWHRLSDEQRDDVRTVLDTHSGRLTAPERAELARAVVRLFDVPIESFPDAFLQFLIWCIRDNPTYSATQALELGWVTGTLLDLTFPIHRFGMFGKLYANLRRVQSRLPQALARYLQVQIRRAELRTGE